MSNIRLFFQESLSINLSSNLNRHQSHYLTKVMRIKPGENFSLFNETGEWQAKINEIRPSVSLIYKRIPRTLKSLFKLKINFYRESLNTKNL